MLLRAWSRQSRLDEIDHSLNFVAQGIERAREAGKDPISEANLLADENPVKLSIAFTDAAREPLWVGTVLTGEHHADLEPSLNRPGEVISLDGQIRALTVPVGGEGMITVLAPYTNISDAYTDDIVALLAFWIPFNALLALLVGVVVHRSVRPIQDLVSAATAAANGELVAPRTYRGGAEEQELQHALQKMVQSLRSALAHQEAVNTRMQTFIGDASHELRTPITVLSGYVQLLKDNNSMLSETERRWVERMASESERMTQLIDDLLLLAESADGAVAYSVYETTELSDLLIARVSDLRNLQPDRPVETHIDPALVHGNPENLRRAVDNIFSNLIRHTPADAPVHIELSVFDEGVYMIVEDGGQGLPDDVLERGVETFQRFDDSRSRSTGGSGLGMSILTAVTASLGGTVTLYRSELGGLGVNVTLPLAASSRLLEDL